MAQKRFKADLRFARREIDDTGVPGVLDLERGDSEGEARFTFVHETLDAPLSIRLLAQSLDAYPNDNSFLFFTDVEDVSPVVVSALNELPATTFGQTILECVRNVADGVAHALSSVDANGDTVMTENSGNLFEDTIDNYWNTSDNDEEIFGLPSRRQPGSKNPEENRTFEGLHELRKDLRTIRQTGCRVGVLNGLNAKSLTHTISISLRANKFGLSSETLEVWDIEPSDYIVLLIQVEGRYFSTNTLRSSGAYQTHIKFRFGKCTAYKPSFQAASDAFNPNIRPTNWNGQEAPKNEPEAKPFVKLFISNSLDRFMNEDFINLVRLRLRGSRSWEDANLHLQNVTDIHDVASSNGLNADTVTTATRSVANGESPSIGPGQGNGQHQANRPFQAIDERPSNGTPKPILADPFTLPHDDIGLPLAAMHFASHYFARCTEYCLRCHRRLPKDFEALKPFVCSSPLCLFQYMTMGLGPSIEHEILTQPYVVDLLVSLCYSSVSTKQPQNSTRGYPIREFPTGLRLKVPCLSTREKSIAPIDPVASDIDPNSIKVEGDIEAQVVTLTNPLDLRFISPGMLANIQQRLADSSEQPLKHQVLISHIDHDLNRVNFELKHRDPSHKAYGSQFDKHMFLAPLLDFDDLNDDEKAGAIVALLNSLPPIADLRKFLLQRPNGSLTSYPGLLSSTRTLLQWIVASNRSYILQVSPVQEKTGMQTLIGPTKIRPQEEIPGLQLGYIQFRFVQGSPDKELRFHRALDSLTDLNAKKYPTLFAWHGSNIANWHSILRQGLDYTQIHNGRSYGNGVYFSKQYTTSAQYASESPWLTWPSSAIQARKLLAMCEIVNSPSKFLSSNPYLVVPDVDWIQCRYLIVQCGTVEQPYFGCVEPGNVELGGVGPGGGPLDMEEVPQDPKHRIFGPGGKCLKIPIKALPSSRTAQQKTESEASFKRLKTRSNTPVTDEEDAADLEAILSDVGSLSPRQKPLQPKSAASASEPLTDFRPTALDLSSLPRLELPQWAGFTSSKRLAAEIKYLQKVQTLTPLHELGWYVHLDNLENMFQWIVELHSFDPELPLARDMKKADISSVVLEVRFGRNYPFSPPFVRVIRPRFLPFMEGGGGHVTIGGAICMELLTSTGWTPILSMEGVFVSIKMALSSVEPKPARLQDRRAKASRVDYTPIEALDAYQRAATRHGWEVPPDVRENAAQAAVAASGS